MRPISIEEETKRSLEGDTQEVRYTRWKICHFCTLTKIIVEEDDICRDCWTLRMFGRLLVACPFFQYENGSLLFPDGKIPVEFCYDCAYRRGWTLELGPICGHPVAVDIVERWGVEMVKCPDENLKTQTGAFVPTFNCVSCRWYRGELTTRSGRFAYCGFPCAKPTFPDEGDLGKEKGSQGWMEKRECRPDEGSRSLG